MILNFGITNTDIKTIIRPIKNTARAMTHNIEMFVWNTLTRPPMARIGA